MPRLAFHAIPTEAVQAAHPALMADFDAILGPAAAHTVFEVVQSTFIPAPSFPFVEVALFDRGPEIQDALARSLTQRLKEAGCASVDIAFRRMEPRGYYEDGAALGV